ncbi:MAG: hypothetical protein IJT75_02150, partial [Bacteroidaceae bacterium]|nr:hypothetical protein [Bacteroidaceae bacterium]
MNCITCKIDGVKYEAGTYVMNETDLATYKAATGGHTYTDADGQTIKDANDQPVGDDYIFRLSNNVSHNTGYILTYKVDNPAIWNTWYTPKNNTDGSKITLAAYNELTANKDKYEDGPTYRLRATEGGELLGQRNYEVGDIISEDIQTTYTAIPAGKKPTTGQAVFEQAYVVTQTTTVTVGTTEHHLNKGTTIIKSDYEDVDHNWLAALQGKVDEAYICTRTIQQTKENLIYKDSKLSEADKDAYISDVKGKMKYTIGETTYDVKDKSIDEIKALTGITDDKKKELLQLATLRDDLNTYLVPAYACQTAGKYGGDYYEAGRNYRGLEAWSSMTESDRAQFIYNYDALDLLIDPTYSRNADGTVNYAEGQKYQYDDSEGTLAKAQANLAHYSLQQPVDYTASYNGKDGDATETAEGDNNGKKYMTVSTDIISSGKVYIGDELTREQFESLPNEQRHFSSIAVKSGVSTYYVVSVAFQVGSTPYAVGETISSEIYKGLPDSQKDCVTELKFTTAPTEDKAYYYCREEFDRTTSIATVSSSDIANAGTGYSGGKVAKGSIIEKTTYDNLPNDQKNFTIHGVSPTETSTLYVSRESDIYDLSQEKIITVIYQYDYDETDSNGNVTPISERHVVNIHLNFRSGVPTVEDIEQPEIILP